MIRVTVEEIDGSSTSEVGRLEIEGMAVLAGRPFIGEYMVRLGVERGAGNVGLHRRVLLDYELDKHNVWGLVLSSLELFKDTDVFDNDHRELETGT